MVISFLRSLYDKDYHFLSGEKIKQYKEALEKNYRELYDKYKISYFSLDKFRGRYQKAVEKKYNMYYFFELEIERMETLVSKAKEYKEEKDKRSKNFFEKLYNQSDNKNHSMIEKIYVQFEERIKAYPHVPIHQNASEEIERLLGCLQQFERKHYEGILEFEKWFKNDKNFQNLIQEIKNQLYDLASSKSGNLPFVFVNYRFKVDNSDDDYYLVELADISVLKKVVHLMKQLRKIINWMDEKLSMNDDEVKIKYEEEFISFKKFRYCLKTDCNKILRDFRLESLV